MLNVNRTGAYTTEGEAGTLESEAIKRVLRESWQNEMNEKKQTRDMMTALEAHARTMRSLLGTFDYESTCMKNITVNARLMKPAELKEYTRMVEALASGYSIMYDKEIMWLLLSGLTQLSRNARSVKKYLDLFLKNAGKKESVSTRRAVKARDSVETLLRELKTNESSIFRMFRKKRIETLKRRVHKASKVADKEGARAKKYSEMTRRVKDMVNTASQRSLTD